MIIIKRMDGEGKSGGGERYEAITNSPCEK